MWADDDRADDAWQQAANRGACRLGGEKPRSAIRETMKLRMAEMPPTEAEAKQERQKEKK